MRLLLIAQQFRDFASGLGTYARGLVEGILDRGGHQVTLAVPASQAVDLPGLRTVPVDFAPGNVTPFSIRGMARAHRRVFGVEAGSHDLVHFLDAREIAFLPRSGVEVPVLGTVHDTYALDWRGEGFPRHLYGDRRIRGVFYAWLRRLERRVYSRAAALIANSDHVAKAVASGYGIGEDGIEVIRIGLRREDPVDPEELAGDPAVLFVGANVTRKGLPTLIGAVGALLSSHPRIRLHVVGGEATFPLPDFVVHHGRLPNRRVRAMMAGADVFALPAYVEAFGLVYLEAMRAGTPVIATAAGGAAECFRDGEEALLVPPGNEVALTEALGRLADEKDLGLRLVAGARAALGRLTPEETVGRTVDVYESLEKLDEPAP